MSKLEFDIWVAARSNWVAMLFVLSACALDPDEQLSRDDFDEMFLLEGIDGVRWMFIELGWLSDEALLDLEKFDAAIAAIDALGEQASSVDDTVRESAEWKQLRTVAKACLQSLDQEPWASRG